MPEIKLITIDMDGTLLNSKGELSSKTIDVIKKATKQGVQIVLSTGRPLSGVQPFLEQLGLWQAGHYTITLNGATVQENKTDKMIDHFSMSYVAFQSFFDFARENNLGIHVQDNQLLYTPDKKVTIYTKKEAESTLQKIKKMQVNEMIHLGFFHKIQVVGSCEEMDRAMDVLPEDIRELYEIVRQIPEALDIMAIDAGKGNALMGLSSALGVHLPQTMAIGDGGNDVPMLRNAGLSVVMDNGVDEAKAHADVITDNNDADGVAKAIEKYVLK